MSKEEKIQQAISNKLYTDSKGSVRITPTQLKSIGQRDILSAEILDKSRNLKAYFEEFEEIVTYIDDIRNPYGIYKFMKDYALANGKQHKKKITIETKGHDGVVIREEKVVDDYYEPNSPDTYVIVIVDHAKLVQPEQGKDLWNTIADLSSNYFVQMRNKWGYIPVLIQQQAASQENIEHARFDKLKPSLDGLGDNKTTQQDANLILGLFSPFRHKIPTYEGYSVQRFKDHIRFLEILGGREGGAGIVSPLYFDGAVNFFQELPAPSDEATLSKIYKAIENIETMKK